MRWNNLSAIIDIGVLVFREGLECVLVLASITASLRNSGRGYNRAVAGGVGIAFAATLLTWQVASRVLTDLGQDASALALQAGTGLLAIVVLLVVMNWFFHKLYWTGWIAHHNARKNELLKQDISNHGTSHVVPGMILLGFTSFYREGFEVVLFLQSYRLRLGDKIVGWGVLAGALVTVAIAALTFSAHRHLPYRKMLVATGVLLGLVLLAMVGEEAQEMQLAGWLPVTEIPRLSRLIPGSWGLWFSIFPTVQTLSAQALACLLVVGSYFVAQSEKH